MAKRPTVYDVAEAAGVSIATVSFTFRQPERVRPATREAVMAAARTLHYVPSGSARGLAHGRTGVLGLYSFDMLLDRGQTRPVQEEPGPLPLAALGRPEDLDLDDPGLREFPLYVDEVQRGFELECARRGRVLLIGRGPSQDGAAMIDIASRVDGLAVFPGEHSREFLDQVSRRLPVVAFSMPDGQGAGLHHVRVDNRGGTGALVEHLVEVHGLRDLGFVGATRMPDQHERFEGMRAAMARLGLRAPDEVLDATDLADAAPFRVLRGLAETRRLPQALVCATDQHALAVLDLLREVGVAVPGEVAVTGFDGVLAGRLSEPRLTTVRQPMAAMGRLAVDILVAALEGDGGERAPADHLLPVRPVFRGSCGCPDGDRSA